MRPVDWHPLAVGDPLPGDPEAVAMQAEQVASLAAAIEAQARDLMALARSCDAHSDAVDALRAQAAEVAGQLQRVVGRYRAVGSALRTWAPLLAQVQQEGDHALVRARSAQAELDSFAPDDPRRQAHQDELRAAARLLRDAEDRRDAGARRAADTIRDACEADGLDGHWWSGAASVAGSLVHGVDKAMSVSWLPSLKTVATICAWVATACAIAAMFVSGLAMCALVLAVLTTLLDATLLARGQGSVLTVGLDLLGVGAAKVAVRGITAARAGLLTETSRAEGTAARTAFREGERSRVDAANRTIRGNSSAGAKARARADLADVQRGADAADARARAAALSRPEPKLTHKDWRDLMRAGDTDAAAAHRAAGAARLAHPTDTAVAAAAGRATRAARRRTRVAVGALGVDVASKAPQLVHAVPNQRRSRPPARCIPVPR